MSWAAVAIGGATLIGGAINAGTAKQGQQNTNNANANSDQQAAIARNQYEYWTANYKPLEKSVISQVGQLSSPESQEHQAAVQGAQTAGAYDAQINNLKRNLFTYGQGPTSGAFASQVGALTGAKAAGTATAMNNARWNTLTSGIATQSNVAALGRGIPMTAAGQLGQAAGTQGALANAAYGRYYQNAGNTGYALGALGNAAGAAAPGIANWFGGGIGGSNSSNAYINSGSNNYDMPSSGQYLGGLGTAGAASYSGGMAEGGIARAVNRAPGGAISGPGSETSDSIPAQVDDGSPVQLSDGEQVMNTDAVRILGRDFLDAVNMIGLLKRYRTEQKSPGMADGGAAMAPAGGIQRAMPQEEQAPMPTEDQAQQAPPEQAAPQAPPVQQQPPSPWPKGPDGQPVPGAADSLPFRSAAQLAQQSGMAQFTWKGRTFPTSQQRASGGIVGPAAGGRGSVYAADMANAAKMPLRSGGLDQVATASGDSAMTRDFNGGAGKMVAMIVPRGAVGGIQRYVAAQQGQAPTSQSSDSGVETAPFDPPAITGAPIQDVGDLSTGNPSASWTDRQGRRQDTGIVPKADDTGDYEDWLRRQGQLQPRPQIRFGRMASGGKVGGIARTRV